MTCARTPRRLAAPERQASIERAAAAAFAATGFGGTTTARIATEAKVNEALLFRHFGSKRRLYVACIDATWATVRDGCAALFASEDVAQHWRMPGRSFLQLVRDEPDRARLWVRMLVDTTGVAEIDDHVEETMREAHALVEAAVERSQAAGTVLADRDAATEAWTIMAVGLLGASFSPRGMIAPEAFERVLRAHRTWVTGTPD